MHPSNQVNQQNQQCTIMFCVHIHPQRVKAFKTEPTVNRDMILLCFDSYYSAVCVCATYHNERESSGVLTTDCQSRLRSSDQITSPANYRSNRPDKC